jgi:hypothetical protein
MPLILIPEGCKEGGVLDIAIRKDEKATGDAIDQSKNMIEKLQRKGQGKSGIIQ